MFLGREKLHSKGMLLRLAVKLELQYEPLRRTWHVATCCTLQYPSLKASTAHSSAALLRFQIFGILEPAFENDTG